MNTSSQTYKQLSIPYFKEIFDCIDSVMFQLNVPYYLIGATATALELLKEGIKPDRGTKDIDFAIMISSMQDFQSIVEQLVQFGFAKVAAPWTLYHAEFNVVIDLLPFGEIEQNFTLDFNKRQVDLHVLGFREILGNATVVYIEEKAVQIPTLAGMVILKLIAWSDRPEDREHDLYDILKIIEHYYEWNNEEILKKHYDTFIEAEEFDRLKIAARVLGRSAKQFLDISTIIRKRILGTIEENSTNPSKSAIAKQWIRGKNWTLEYAAELLLELKKGLVEDNIIEK